MSKGSDFKGLMQNSTGILRAVAAEKQGHQTGNKHFVPGFLNIMQQLAYKVATQVPEAGKAFLDVLQKNFTKAVEIGTAALKTVATELRNAAEFVAGPSRPMRGPGNGFGGPTLVPT